MLYWLLCCAFTLRTFEGFLVKVSAAMEITASTLWPPNENP